MKKNTITVIVVALIVVTGAVTFALTRDNTKSSDTQSADMSGHSSQSSQESATYKQYTALKGEDYDRMFLAGMIAHHQGAVDMASLALNQAKHSELKAMAQNIITAQNKEISSMATWQQQWGYPASSGDNMMDHSAMGMENDMAGMTNELKGLSGDAFDKKFLSLMIEHHQSAIDMAKPGATNAQHQEVKSLTSAIVSAQTKEISQMQAWQKEWGYQD